MGRVIVEQIVSADGYTARTDGDISWFENADFSETEDDQLQMLTRVEAIVLGAATYRMFAAYWPGADDSAERIAGPINALPKHIVSTTLAEAPWGKFTPAIVERGDGAQIVAELSRRYTGDLVVWGSLMLTDALFAAGLVDVLRLRIVPVLIGAGRPLAPTVRGDTTLELASALSFPHGHVRTEYHLARG
ncbi:dihydrofolate reductase family protein [Kocuria sp. M4R2S49]|uniref:dihydrofolate reductase family protein n=1 Tax=Kocuria rhizosphaericola TaxID=3376284 RepID=UPI00379E53EB